MRLTPKSKTPKGVLLLIAAQIICAVFFLSDVIDDFRGYGVTALYDTHILIESASAVLLWMAILFEIRLFFGLLRRTAHLESSLSIAQAAMHDVIEAHFESWGLTPSEQDVATFMVKGMSISEIAALRGSAEGTIKAHMHAIYRKSGTHNRGEVLSLLIDSLMEDSPPTNETA
ncbi:helix-turn-helix transcriptional regulator [Shimia sp. FJ5]|uniref:helix-turn-helix transcriptional regulator n=1 Tax=Shimia sp. FJ5 TaxID=3079054 RepID=UPI00260B9AB8|nr:helix-turn-helix transcriptional regulator [Shimia sp. FJ5]MDV4144503.1 helix-turn-helix transcriptional regulator [Shimia sp. FJ5]